MSDLAIRLGSREIDLLSLVDGLGLPDELTDAVRTTLDDPSRTLETIRPELQDELPEKFQFLLDEIDDFVAAELALLEAAKSVSPTGAIGLEASAGANLGLEKLQLGDQNPLDSLIAFGLEGSVELGAGAQAASAVLSVGINAKTNQSRTIQFALDPGSDRLLLESLWRLPGSLVDPTDFSGITAKMGSSPLRRVSRSGRSNNTIGVDIGMNAGLSEALTELGVNVSARFGGSLSLKYQDEADFVLSVEEAGTSFIIDLSKNRKATNSSVLKLGLDVQLVGLREGLLNKISSAMPEAAEVRTLLDRLDGSIDKLSKEHLGSSLGSALSEKWPDGKPIFEVLVGEQTTEAFAEKIQGELQAKIDEIVSHKVDLLNDKAEASAQLVLSNLAAELGLNASQKSKLDGYLEEALESGIDKVQAEFSKAANLRGILPNTRLVELLSPLEGVSDLVDDVLDMAASARPPASKVAAALRDVYERYLRFRSQVINLVKEELEENIAVSIISEKSRTETVSQTLVARVPKADAQAVEVGALYRALWNGDLRDLTGLIAALPPTITVQGEYVRTVERLEQNSITLNMFGFGFSSATIFSDKVKVGHDHTGKLIAATSKAEIERTFTSTLFSREAQAVLVRWQVDYLNKAVLEDPVSIKLSITDDKFESDGEVADFFSPLQRVGLVRMGLSDDVQVALFPTRNARSLRKVDLSLSVSVPWSGWIRLLESADPDALLSSYLEHVKRIGPNDLREAQIMMAEDQQSDLDAYLRELGRVRIDRTSVLQPTPSQRMAYNLGKTFNQLAAAIQLARQSWMDVRHAVENPGASRSEVEAAMLDFNRDFSRHFRGMMIRPSVDNRGKLDWRAAALLALFRDLDFDQATPNPYLSCTFRSASEVTRVFS